MSRSLCHLEFGTVSPNTENIPRQSHHFNHEWRTIHENESVAVSRGAAGDADQYNARLARRSATSTIRTVPLARTRRRKARARMRRACLTVLSCFPFAPLRESLQRFVSAFVTLCPPPNHSRSLASISGSQNFRSDPFVILPAPPRNNLN